MLGAAEAYALGTKLDSVMGILRSISVGADLIHIVHELPVVLVEDGILLVHRTIKDLHDLGRLHRDLLGIHCTCKSIDGHIITLREDLSIDFQGLLDLIHMDLAAAGYARAAHATGNDRRMAGHAATAGDDTLRYGHSADILRAGLRPDKEDVLAERGRILRFLGGEVDLAACASRGCVKAMCRLLEVKLLDVVVIKDRSE